LAGTIEGLVKTIEDRKVVETHSLHPLFAACELVADQLGIKLSLPNGGGDAIDAASRPGGTDRANFPRAVSGR
jgi:hypothetical protein